MKRIFLLFFLVFNTMLFFGNEKQVVDPNSRGTYPLFTFNQISDSDKSPLKQNNQNINESSFYDIINYASDTQTKRKLNKNLIAGIVCLSIGGGLLIVFAPIFIGVGVYLILFTDTMNVHYWSYGSEVYATQTYHPYETEGIVLAAFGGLFFLASIPLIIVGAINLYLGIKKRAMGYNDEKESSRLSLNLNFNAEKKEYDLAFKYIF